jgi:hypothetical protein
MLILFFVECILPNKFQSDGTVEIIAKYKVVWILVGISQILLTVSALFMGILYCLYNTKKKLQLLSEITVVLLISIMWLMIVLPPVFSYYRRYSGLKSVTVTEINNIDKN